MNNINTIDEPVIIERIIKKPVKKVWHAITEAKAISIWFFEIPEFKAEPGFVLNSMEAMRGSVILRPAQ